MKIRCRSSLRPTSWRGARATCSAHLSDCWGAPVAKRNVIVWSQSGRTSSAVSLISWAMADEPEAEDQAADDGAADIRDAVTARLKDADKTWGNGATIQLESVSWRPDLSRTDPKAVLHVHL